MLNECAEQLGARAVGGPSCMLNGSKTDDVDHSVTAMVGVSSGVEVTDGLGKFETSHACTKKGDDTTLM